jgi:membrane protein DedA with SNARE-associated domain
MMEELRPWLQESEGPLAYLVLGLASLVEYVFPPFPGDSVALFGVFLAATAGYSVVWVYALLNLGALGGGMAAYGFGRWIAVRREHRTPRFLRGEQARQAIDAVLTRFERHGAAYLGLNRFVPALRSFFFIAAGMAKLPAWKVAVWGTVSAMAWNALLLALGWAVGRSYERLEGWVKAYSYVALIVVGLASLALLVKYLSRPKEEGEGDPPGET